MADETINAEELQSQADANVRNEIANKWAEKRDALLAEKAPAVEETEAIPDADKVNTPQIKAEAEKELSKLSENQLKQWSDKLTNLYKTETKKAGLTDEEAQAIIDDAKSKGTTEGKYVDLATQGKQMIEKLQQQQDAFNKQIEMQKAITAAWANKQAEQVSQKVRKDMQKQAQADAIKAQADAFVKAHERVSDNIKTAIKDNNPLKADFAITPQRVANAQAERQMQDNVDAISKELDKPLEEEFTKAKEQTAKDDATLRANQGAFMPQMATGMLEGINEAKNLDIEKIAKASADAITKGKGYTEDQKQQVYQIALSKAYDKVKGKTTSNTEHIVRKTFLDNSVANLMKAGAAKASGNYYLNQASQERDAEYGAKHKFANVVGSVGSFVTDLGAMGASGVGGAVGSRVGGAIAGTLARNLVMRSGGKVALNTAMRMVTNKAIVPIAGAMAGGATNLGLWEGMSDATNQLATSKDYSFGQTLGAMGRGAILGTMTGGVGHLIGNITNKAVSAVSSTGAKVGARVGGGLASWGAETTIFATPEMIADPEHAGDIWLDNGAMMAGFKAHSGVKSAGKFIDGVKKFKGDDLSASQLAYNNKPISQRVKEQFKSHPNECKFTPDEEAEIRNGYSGLLNLDSGMSVEEYESLLGKFMNDKNVSASAKSRMAFILTGKRMVMPTILTTEIKEQDGKHVVTAYGLNDTIVMRKSFDDAKQAQKCLVETGDQAQINNVEILESDAKTKGGDVNAIRESVKEDTGKDIGKVLAKSFEQRTDEEHDAYADYMDKLAQVKPKEEKLEVETSKDGKTEEPPISESEVEQRAEEERTEDPSEENDKPAESEEKPAEEERTEEPSEENDATHEREDDEQKVTTEEATTEESSVTEKGETKSEDATETADEADNTPTLANVISTIYDKGKQVASKLFGRSFFDVVETPEFMKQLGILGTKFTIRYGVISRHCGKDAQHNLSKDVWLQLPKALCDPLCISKYYSDEKKEHQKGYRIYTPLQLEDGSFVMVSAEVISSGKNLLINKINTVFGRPKVSTNHEDVIYTKKEMTPEQKSLLDGTTPHQYPTEQVSSSVDKVSESVETAQEKGKENAEHLSEVATETAEDELSEDKPLEDEPIEGPKEGERAEADSEVRQKDELSGELSDKLGNPINEDGTLKSTTGNAHKDISSADKVSETAETAQEKGLNSSYQDVGEKIGGAKKDLAQERLEQIRTILQEGEEESLTGKSVSKLFDFNQMRENGFSNEVVSAIEVLINTIPNKPRTPSRITTWTIVYARPALRAIERILHNPTDAEAWSTIKDRNLSEKYQLYLEIGGYDSLLGVPNFTIERVGNKMCVYDFLCITRIASFDTREDAIEGIKSIMREKKEQRKSKSKGPKDVELVVYRVGKQIKICPNGKPKVVLADGFATGNEAIDYAKKHNEELQSRYRDLLGKRVEFKKNRKRYGPDWRNGENVGAEKFRQTFGFRAVEFGNWMNTEDRKDALNECFDALMDLAEVCGVSPLALSLNGELAFAFGARGGGKANAHYEPAKVVINLTKTKGAGAVAHEWFHAIDAYFAKMGGASLGNFASDGVLRTKASSVREEMIKAWDLLMSQIKNSEYYKRSQNYSELHKSKYWDQPTELGARAFSVWVEQKLAEKGMSNDYLANNPHLLDSQIDDDVNTFYPYPFENDAEWIGGAFGHLFDTMQEKVDEATGNHVLYRIGDSANDIEAVSAQFDKELQQQINGTLPTNHTYSLGLPCRILSATGVPTLPIQMSAKRLLEKATLFGHNFSLKDVKGLVKALQHPMAVFAYGDKTKSQNIIIPLQKGGKTFIVGLSLNPIVKGAHLEINSIRNVFPKDNAEWLNWITQGKSLYLDKAKIQNLIAQQRTNLADVDYLDLDSVTKLIESFENPKEIKEFEEKNLQNLSEVATETAEALGMKVRFAYSDELKGRDAISKGWHKPGTDEMVIVLDNNVDADDIRETVYHEGVAHYGLRKMFGSEFDNFIQNVYEHTGTEIRNAIAEIGVRKGYAPMEATEEYLAKLAEDGKFRELNPTTWEKIKYFFKGMLSRFGLHEISDEELRYSLWRSYQLRINGSKPTLMERAMDIAMQHRFKLGNYAPRSQRLYRTMGGGQIPKRKIAKEYDEQIGKSGYQAKEAFLDENASLDWYLRKASMLKYQEDVPGHINPYLGANRVGQVTKEDIEFFKRDFADPIHKEVRRLMDEMDGEREERYQKVTEYLMAKHGLERNNVMRQRATEERAREIYERAVDQLPALEGKLKVAAYDLQQNPNDPSCKTAYDNALLARDEAQQIIDDAQADWGTFVASHDVAEVKARQRLQDLQTAQINAMADVQQAQTKMQKSPNNKTYIKAYDKAVARLKAIQDEINYATNEWDLFVLQYSDDYAGLTGLTKGEAEQSVPLDEATRRARQIVKSFESAHKTDELWKRINKATHEILRKQYEGGMISEDKMNEIADTYQYYVPLRGFSDTTADEEYAYLQHGEGRQNVLKKAEGRSSMADDPIAYIEQMANDGIIRANDNALVKRTFLDFVQSHPTDLISATPIYIHRNPVSRKWEMADLPQIDPNDSAEVVEEKMRKYVEQMENLIQTDSRNYRKVSEKVKIPYIIDKNKLKEHQIIAYRDGVPTLMTVNGNPRLAQAINNVRARTEGAVESIVHTMKNLTRKVSMMYTGMNLDFIPSNFTRDSIFANTIVWIKESPKYALQFNKNYLALGMKDGVFTTAQLFKKYRDGTLDMNNYTEKMFYEFMRNGAEVSYAEMASIEKTKKNVMASIEGKKTLGETITKNAVAQTIADIARGVENRARFAAYLTSREAGRDIARSVWDAREISVNFITRGARDKYFRKTGQTFVGNASGLLSEVGNIGYAFFNASLQGSANFARAVNRNRAKGLAMCSGLFALGLATAWLGKQQDDDDDDNKYFDQPKHLRRQNMIVKSGKNWITVPLNTEYRAFFGFGEMVGSQLFNGDEVSASDVAMQFTQLAPVDVLEGSKAFIPTAIKPLAEASSNESWYGSPIWKETPYNELAPQYTKSYSSTPKYMVEWAEKLNTLSGGNKYRKGTLDWNPATIDYLLKQYGGSFYALPRQMYGAVKDIKGDKDFNWRDVPIANRFIKTGGDERRTNASLNEKFEDIRQKYEMVWYDFNNTRKDRLMDTDERYQHLEDMMQNEGDWLRLKGLMKGYDKLTTRRNQMSKAGNQEAVKAINERIQELKQIIVERVEEAESKK